MKSITPAKGKGCFALASQEITKVCCDAEGKARQGIGALFLLHWLKHLLIDKDY